MDVRSTSNMILSTRFLLTRVSGFAPIAMSLAAVGVVVFSVLTGGTRVPAGDEGTLAHLWQLLVAVQVPVIGWFGVRWAPLAPRPGLTVLGAQIACALAALAPVLLLHL
jgi:hypothetical protein